VWGEGGGGGGSGVACSDDLTADHKWRTYTPKPGNLGATVSAYVSLR